MPPPGPEIVDLRALRSEELLQEVAEGLYLSSFPFPEEREDPAIWPALLWGEDQRPKLHLLVAGEGLESPSPAVYGFAAAEYYEASNCGLLSYIAVAPDRRAAGLSRRLMKEVTRALRDDAQARGEDLAALFAEVHDPAKVPAARDTMPPSERLAVMAALGARRVPIDYVQPELSQDGERARTLLLIAFPVGGADHESLPASVVRDFLQELYVALGIEDPCADPDFERATRGLGREPLRLLPLL